jgi:hypothetical protein
MRPTEPSDGSRSTAATAARLATQAIYRGMSLDAITALLEHKALAMVRPHAPCNL